MKTKSIFLVIILAIVFNNSNYSQSQWVKTSSSPGTNINCLEKNGSNLLAGTQAGIYISTDNGNNWALSGLVNIPVNTIATNGSYVFAGTDDEVYFSSNTGTTWTIVNHHNNGLIYFNITALAISGSNIYAGANGGTNLGGVYISTNNASSWTAISTGISDKNIQSLATINSIVFAGTLNNGVWLTNNNAIWTFAGLTNNSINCLSTIGTYLFAGTTTNGVYFSTDYGSNWISASGSGLTGLTNKTINAMITSGTNIFVGTPGGGVFLSTDNGSDWTNVSSGLTEVNIRSLTILGSNMFLATSNGNIWKRPLSEMITSNSLSIKNAIQKQWLNISTGIRTLSLINTFQGNVGQLSYTAQSSNTTVATVSVTGSTLNITPISLGDCIITITSIDAANSNSLNYSFDVNVGITDVESDPIPIKYALHQNFPNPFNPTTSISYQIPNQSRVTLKIYDLLGNQIVELINKDQSAGSYTVSFNASKISSGIYFYKLQTGNFISTKKMVLMK